MDHVVIMKKEWGLLPKILSGVKKVESRWYKFKIAPWNKVKKGDILYFKDSGGQVTVKAKVTDVHQYFIESDRHALEIMQKYAKLDLGVTDIPIPIKNYIKNKKFAIFVFFTDVKKTNPININKTGFGLQSAWLCVKNIESIKKIALL